MLVTFEGRARAGKSAVLSEVDRQLKSRGVDYVTVAHLWSSAESVFATDPLSRNEVQEGTANDSAAVIERTMRVAQGLYRRDEEKIGPALRSGAIVLADRHTDTVIYTLAPALARLAAFVTRERAVVWLSMLLSGLRHKPDLTIHVDSSLPTRSQRIEECRRALHLEGSEATAATIEAFDAYSRVAEQLIGGDSAQVVTIESGNRPLEQVALPVTEAICARLTPV